jgi:hypothetical protein
LIARPPERLSGDEVTIGQTNEGEMIEPQVDEGKSHHWDRHQDGHSRYSLLRSQRGINGLIPAKAEPINQIPRAPPPIPVRCQARSLEASDKTHLASGTADQTQALFST